MKDHWAALSPRDRLLGMARGIGVLILLYLPISLFSAPVTGLAVGWPGARTVWTVIIALLPLFIVAVGFYTWRQICPLSFFARVSEWIGWPDQRTTREEERRRIRAPEWLARHYPYVTWGFLAVMLALRILLINSSALALAWTLVGLMALAMAVGFRYTGKTWCQFICPVYVIELLYTDGDRPQYAENSICPACTGCKTKLTGGLCTDINQENDYWQELKLPARAFAYYSFPGLVLGFYFWYFLHRPYYWHELYRRGILSVGGRPINLPQPGTTYDWGYYLSGDWMRDPQPWAHWLDRGFGFHGQPDWISQIPVIAAVPLTLTVFSVLSYALFRGIESLWLKARVRRGMTAASGLEAVRHPLFAWAGFTAFCIFYEFAGAPTFRQLPLGLYDFFRAAVFVFAAWVLNTRLRRSRAKHVQFDQARRWVKKWPFSGEAPPADLDHAYTTYTLRMQFSQDRLRVFKDTVRSMLAENRVGAGEVELLDRLASDLGVSEADQKKMVRELGKEAPELFDPRYQGSLRDGLRLIGYRNELERALSENGGVLPDRAALAEMQARYRIQPAEHEEALRELRTPEGPRAQHLRRELAELRQARSDAIVLAAYSDPAVDFLRQELERGLREDRDHVLRIVNLYGPAGELDPVRAALQQPDEDPNVGEPLAAWVRAHLPAELAADVFEAVAPNLDFGFRAGERSEGPVPGSGRLDLNPSPDENSIQNRQSKIQNGNALASVLLRLSQHGSFCVRAAAVYSLGLVLASSHVPPADTGPTQPLAGARAEEALQDPHPLVRGAAAAALAARTGALPRLLPRSSLGTRREPDSRPPDGRPAPPLTTLEKLFALRRVPLLTHLLADAIYPLADQAGEALFEPGEALCTQGEISDAVYLLIEGEAEVVRERNGQEVHLGVIHTGECVGEMAVLNPGPRTATVRAVDAPVRALAVPGDAFRALLAQDPSTTLGLVRLLIQRQREAFAAS